MLETPILLIIFNRPETTKHVFESIRKIQPKQLFIAADGPRPDKKGENERCESARKIATSIDWDCKLHTLFRNENIGCGLGPAKAITWFFEHVEQGIILEDDCLPDISFFSFCEILLNYYKFDNRIMHISGNCFYPNSYTASYYFSAYTHIWGWATWRRAWVKYDFNLINIDEKKLRLRINKIFSSGEERKFWLAYYYKVLNTDNKDFWDYQWCIAVWYYAGLAILPTKNLVSNIGFGNLATHTHNEKSPIANMKTVPLNTIIYNDRVKLDKRADYYSSKSVFHILTKKDILYQKIKKVLTEILKINNLKNH